MYIPFHQVYKCSKCGAVDSDEIVIRKFEKLRRCRVCGHTVIIEDNNPFRKKDENKNAVYKLDWEDLNKPIEF